MKTYLKRLVKIQNGRISPMAKINRLMDLILELKENPRQLSHEELKATAILTMRVIGRV